MLFGKMTIFIIEKLIKTKLYMRFNSQDRLTVENKVFDDVCEGIINLSECWMMLFITRECFLKKTDSVEMSCGFLAKKLGFSRRRVMRYNRSLEEKGYITVKHNSNDKVNSPNTIKIDASLWLFG